MSDEEMLKVLSDINVGEKIIVEIETIFGGTVELYGEYHGGLEQYGFYSRNGGWGLYSIQKYIPELTELPCYKFLFKEKRKISILKIGFEVKSIKVK